MVRQTAGKLKTPCYVTFFIIIFLLFLLLYNIRTQKSTLFRKRHKIIIKKEIFMSAFALLCLTKKKFTKLDKNFIKFFISKMWYFNCTFLYNIISFLPSARKNDMFFLIFPQDIIFHVISFKIKISLIFMRANVIIPLKM